VLDERYDEVDDIVRPRVPSMQVAGPHHRTSTLHRHGRAARRKVRSVSGTRAQFSGLLRNKCDLADLKLGRLLDTIDEWAWASGLDDSVPPRTFADERARAAALDLDLYGEIRTIWATGFRPDSWLDVDVLDAKSMVRHDGGVVVDAPGMYVIGMPFLRRRKSSFIDGACDDAQDLAHHLAAFLDGRAPRAG
jgi:putative flavoprotein involved in K+ transport